MVVCASAVAVVAGPVARRRAAWTEAARAAGRGCWPGAAERARGGASCAGASCGGGCRSPGRCCAGWVLVGGLPGCWLGLAAGVGAWRWLRRARRAGGDPAEAYDAAVAARQLPLAADLLAACIAAGAGPVTAAQAVGEALGGPVGERLARGAAEVRLGGEPAEAWRGLAAMPGAGALARLLERADESGVPAAEPVARLAAEARAEWGRTATARARRAAVLVTAPVGLCFLPAFIAVGRAAGGDRAGGRGAGRGWLRRAG